MDNALAIRMELRDKLSELYERERLNKLLVYSGKLGQRGAATIKQREFHDAGEDYRLRLFMAGNQSGKTWAGGAEWAYHMTGRYPPDWTGKRFARPVRLWASSDTSETTRDGVQRVLLGENNEFGTGLVPADALAGTPTIARTIPDAISKFAVKHVSGGISMCQFKSYEQGRKKWQSETLDGIWYDEEPPLDIWTEGLTRLNRKRGIALITFTPLLGMTQVVKLFRQPDPKDKGALERKVVQMDLTDATFYSEEDVDRITSQYSESEREARIHGNPAVGSGLIYPFAWDQLIIEPFKLNEYMRFIAGIDFGWDHPAAGVWLAHDPDTDIIYMYDCFKESRLTTGEVIQNFLARGKQIPVSWPHDGHKTDPKSGVTFARIYEKGGLKMLPESARYDDDTGGPQGREPIISDVYQRAKSGRFKVFDNPQNKKLRDEMAGYHRKDGLVQALDDDVISALHYGIMMLRHARSPYLDALFSSGQGNSSDYDPMEVHDHLNNGSYDPTY